MMSYAVLHRMRTISLACALFLIYPAPARAEEVKINGGQAPFSMEFRDADIKDVLRAVGQAAGLNMIIGDTISGQVTMSLKDVDLWEAMEAILKTKGLTYVRDANMIRVLAVSEARDDDMETRVFSLGHANSQDILSIVDKVKSDRAKISVDARMNALVVKDLSLHIDRIARLLKNLDVRMPQVLIEAKIVEVSSNYAREMGVQWGGKYAGSSNGNTSQITGGTMAAGASVGGTAFNPMTGGIGLSGNAYAVNLPAAVGQGSGGALGITFGKVGGRLSLDLQLSAMQTTGNGRILSSPKVMTVNNKEAKISSGIDIPVRVLSTTGGVTSSTIQTISASLVLSTIPTITNDKKIAMVIRVEKSEPDFARQVDNIPTITKRSANAELVVNNGETVVLGGILTKSEGESESGVPLLSKIPLLGWLFKKKGSFDNQSELMIFITPTVMAE